ncbi:MAG: hypothetical protein C0596_11585 [Marinilabiliales bacterium]|nr:MAG: hypothetical protein C0596_11585 [Marinilabiliales bacterium]
MRQILIILLALMLLFLSSCTEENDSSNDVFWGDEYFPLQTGNTLIYKITDIYIDKPSNVYDTSIYYIKEVVDIQLLDNENDTAYRIERYSRNNNDENWIIHSVWSSKVTENTAEKVEENYRLIKIRFPLKEDYSWNGNLYNELEDQTFTVTSFNIPYTTGEFAFDSCLFIYQDSSESLIHKDISYEVYAIHTGLVYKEETYINSQEVIFEVPVEERITTGTIFKQELVEIE